MCTLDNIEERFCKATDYPSLSQYPMPKSKGFATDKGKSKDFAEVFTPPHIVDAMLNAVPNLNSTTRNLDLCSGHGQFTVRMLRKFSQETKGFDPSKYLRNKNFFAELQLESCYKLLWIRGSTSPSGMPFSWRSCLPVGRVYGCTLRKPGYGWTSPA